jgi:hypothetical protein
MGKRSMNIAMKITPDKWAETVMNLLKTNNTYGKTN